MKLKNYLNDYQLAENEFITISNYLSICDFVYKPFIQFKEALNVNKGASNIGNAAIIKEAPPINSVIMCRVMDGEILELFKKCKKNTKNKYIVIQPTVMDDGRVDKLILKALPDNVIKLYAKNVDVVHERIHSIPIGRDFRNEAAYLSAKLNSTNRPFSNVVYCNFAINTNEKNRRNVYNLFKEKDWVTQVKVQEWLNYPISREEYLRQLHSHKFCLSPEGAGIDCFRTWEALYSKSIPIVQESIHVSAFKDLPILFTKDYSEITKNYLENKYEEMLETDYNMDKLHFSYWKHLIMKDKKLISEKNEHNTISKAAGKNIDINNRNIFASTLHIMRNAFKRSR